MDVTDGQRQQLLDRLSRFVVSARRIAGIRRIAILGSIVTAKPDPKDIDVLRTLGRYNRVRVGAAGQSPCAGVYAVVEAPGAIRIGDRVALT